MGLPQWMTPGRRRRANLELNIGGVAESARSETQLHGFGPRLTRLWWALCNQAEHTVNQLIIGTDDGSLDWGLKRHRGKVDYPRLVAIYWWMLLYHLVLFRNRGLTGHSPDEDLPIVSDAAHSFLQREFSRLPTPAPLPSPWDEQWLRQYTLESALGIYSQVYQLLGLHNDLNSRIAHISHFTTATERAYDRLADDLRSDG